MAEFSKKKLARLAAGKQWKIQEYIKMARRGEKLTKKEVEFLRRNKVKFTIKNKKRYSKAKKNINQMKNFSQEIQQTFDEPESLGYSQSLVPPISSDDCFTKYYQRKYPCKQEGGICFTKPYRRKIPCSKKIRK